MASNHMALPSLQADGWWITCVCGWRDTSARSVDAARDEWRVHVYRQTKVR